MQKQWSGADTVRLLEQQLTQEVMQSRQQGIVPTLAILRVGERADDLAYERGAIKRCERMGIEARQFVLPSDATQSELFSAIDQINDAPDIDGCLMFRPLPEHLDDRSARMRLSPAKDVDGITDGSLSAIFSGGGDGFSPCTAQACIEMLKSHGVNCRGKHAVVVGRSLVVGKPLAMLLLNNDATVTICHSKTENLAAICQNADILIVAAGQAGMIGREAVSPGQIVLDVGIHMGSDQKLCGDVRFDEVSEIVGAITPVPGGVGAVTTTVLAKHVVEASRRRR